MTAVSRAFPLALLLLATACAAPGTTGKAPEYARTGQELLPYEQQNQAYRWLDVMQEAAARDVDLFGARPTVLSRQMMIWAASMYEAWAAYDGKAVGTRLGGTLRRPANERDLAHKNIAISYASYRSLLATFPDQAGFLRGEMVRLGFDPDDLSTDTTTPQGIGNFAAAAVIAHRQKDGANADGKEANSAGTPYSDYTGYRPVNDKDTITDPDRWQPIEFTRPDGTKFTPGFLTPHWYRMKPFAIESAAQFRPEPPPTTM